MKGGGLLPPPPYSPTPHPPGPPARAAAEPPPPISILLDRAVLAASGKRGRPGGRQVLPRGAQAPRLGPGIPKAKGPPHALHCWEVPGRCGPLLLGGLSYPPLFPGRRPPNPGSAPPGGARSGRSAARPRRTPRAAKKGKGASPRARVRRPPRPAHAHALRAPRSLPLPPDPRARRGRGRARGRGRRGLGGGQAGLSWVRSGGGSPAAASAAEETKPRPEPRGVGVGPGLRGAPAAGGLCGPRAVPPPPPPAPPPPPRNRSAASGAASLRAPLPRPATPGRLRWAPGRRRPPASMRFGSNMMPVSGQAGWGRGAGPGSVCAVAGAGPVRALRRVRSPSRGLSPRGGAGVLRPRGERPRRLQAPGSHDPRPARGREPVAGRRVPRAAQTFLFLSAWGLTLCSSRRWRTGKPGIFLLCLKKKKKNNNFSLACSMHPEKSAPAGGPGN